LATDFPETTTSTNFTLRLDPNTGILLDLSADPLSPLFVEPADTVGRAGVRLAVSYLHADFTTINGRSLDGLSRTVLFQTAGLLDPGHTTYSTFDLTSDTIFATGTYGITEVFDVGFVVPIISTRLALVQQSASAAARFMSYGAQGSAAGGGDVRLRTKYRLLDNPLRLTPLLELRFPTGSAEDFRGLDSFFVGLGGAASWTRQPFAVHANLKFNVATDDPSRSYIAYGAAVSV